MSAYYKAPGQTAFRPARPRPRLQAASDRLQAGTATADRLQAGTAGTAMFTEVVLKMLKEAEIVAANGGNEENYAIILHYIDLALGRELSAGDCIGEEDHDLRRGPLATTIRDGVRSGSMYFLGQGGGSMFGVGPMMSVEP